MIITPEMMERGRESAISHMRNHGEHIPPWVEAVALHAVDAALTAALGELGPLEDVLKANNWRLCIAHDHSSDGDILQPTFHAHIKDWHHGMYVAGGEGSTIDAAIRNAVDNAKG